MLLLKFHFNYSTSGPSTSPLNCFLATVGEISDRIQRYLYGCVRMPVPPPTSPTTGRSLYGYLLLTAWRSALTLEPQDRHDASLLSSAHAWLFRDLLDSVSEPQPPPAVYCAVLGDISDAHMEHLKAKYLLNYAEPFLTVDDLLLRGTALRKRLQHFEAGFEGVVRHDILQDCRALPSQQSSCDFGGAVPVVKIGRLLVLWSAVADASGTATSTWLESIRVLPPASAAAGAAANSVDCPSLTFEAMSAGCHALRSWQLVQCTETLQERTSARVEAACRAAARAYAADGNDLMGLSAESSPTTLLSEVMTSNASFKC
jgi:hypothetical protein